MQIPGVHGGMFMDEIDTCITCKVDQVITACAFNFTCEIQAYLVGKDGGKRIKIPKI